MINSKDIYMIHDQGKTEGEWNYFKFVEEDIYLLS